MPPAPTNLKFGVTMAEYRSVQPAFRPPPSRLRSWRALPSLFLIASGIAGLAAFQNADGKSPLPLEEVEASVFLFVTAALVLAALYYADRRGLRLAARNYEAQIQYGYQRVHCRDERTFHSDDYAFTFACKCASVTRPWGELRGLTENALLFAFLTGGNVEVLPKAAFQTEAERTEFRRGCSEVVDREKPVTAPSITYNPTLEQYRAARWLNFYKAGGWRPFVQTYAILAAVAVLVAIGLSSFLPIVVGAILMITTTYGVMNKTRGRRWYVGPITIAFDERGLYIQDSSSLVRAPWEDFLGYVENKEMYLLFSNPKKYRMIPMKALGPKHAQFEAVLKGKLRPYDYRTPLAKNAPPPIS